MAKGNYETIIQKHWNLLVRFCVIIFVGLKWADIYSTHNMPNNPFHPGVQGVSLN